VQFLPTLLLPGTSLRRRARALGLRAEPRPPYRVISTPDMGQAELAAAQRLAERAAGRRMDCATRRFVGVGLPDLFSDRHRVPLDAIPRPWALPGCERHRALMFRGRDLFARRETIRRWIRLAIRSEPFALWQFVLEPADEEPLDLLDALIEEIDRAAPHLVDRMTVTPRGRARAARRVMVRLRRGGRHSRSWARAAESMLAGAFH
jgi:hypothetical protein